MRHLIILTTGLFLIGTAPVAAAPIAPSGLQAAPPPVILVQDKPKKGESLTKKVKRAWRDLVGYHFDVSCPFNRTTCSETGKDRGEAQAKCISRNPVCWVSEAK